MASIAPVDVGALDCAPVCAFEDFCDSDCDGWFDSVEIDNGIDPCDPLDPPFSPEPGTEAGICDPSVVIEIPLACEPICIFDACDSDCDGWFDSVEVVFGEDPCNPFSPPFSPSVPAGVCEAIINGKSKAVKTSDKKAWDFRYKSQQQLLILGG